MKHGPLVILVDTMMQIKGSVPGFVGHLSLKQPAASCTSPMDVHEPTVATKKQPHMPSRRAMKSVLGPSKEQALNLGLSATVIFRHYTA